MKIVRQDAEQGTLEACAPQYPFWTWFIDNPGPSSLVQVKEK
jgi:hypothetical protein